MIAAGRHLAAELAATPYASRLGLRAGDVMGDVATASLPYAPLLANAQGLVHGGVAASLSVWSAMVVAVASDQAPSAFAYPVSLSVSYLSAAREEALHATARVTSRGRDLVHAEVEVTSERGRPVAVALAVLRTRREAPRRASSRTTPPSEGGDGRRLISPFSQAMGIALRLHAKGSVEMEMPRDLNEGLGGAVDPGALVALADTCAALACVPSLDERLSGSATLSLSAVFGNPLCSPVLATGRPVAEDGGVRSALVEVQGDAGLRRAANAAMTACVAYRFLAAENPR